MWGTFTGDSIQMRFHFTIAHIWCDVGSLQYSTLDEAQYTTAFRSPFLNTLSCSVLLHFFSFFEHRDLPNKSGKNCNQFISPKLSKLFIYNLFSYAVLNNTYRGIKMLPFGMTKTPYHENITLHFISYQFNILNTLN